MFAICVPSKSQSLHSVMEAIWGQGHDRFIHCASTAYSTAWHMYALSKYLWRQWTLYLIFSTLLWSAYYYFILQIKKLRFSLSNSAQTTELMVAELGLQQESDSKSYASEPYTVQPLQWLYVDVKCCPNAQYSVSGDLIV